MRLFCLEPLCSGFRDMGSIAGQSSMSSSSTINEVNTLASSFRSAGFADSLYLQATRKHDNSRFVYINELIIVNKLINCYATHIHHTWHFDRCTHFNSRADEIRSDVATYNPQGQSFLSKFRFEFADFSYLRCIVEEKF